MTAPTNRRHPLLLVMPLLAFAMPLAAQTAQPPKERSGIDKVGDTVENIGAKPLKDMNIIKPKVAPELEAVMAAPYALTGLRTCVQYKAAIGKLTVLLGPDVDSAQAARDNKTPAEFALSLGETAAGSLIPGMGIVRMVSGADKRQKYAQAAIYAGSVRRAYLKGTARAKGCKV